MELLLIIGTMFFLALLIQRGSASTEETQHIVVVQARPQTTGCFPLAMFLLGALIAAIVVGRLLSL
jgi:hypothetical protein